ncbi:helix-turn-helix domain-containing protein [Streptomyces murinus]|uniref:AraC-like DNA-binding protein n=1 Tax=Streptomyces murinus TaxID=33900 RepID=A0A7W3NTY5_STRMR|nr:helix-turn-helix domain-containing protein [Streptomyces murinus]MBA9056674.1 AraC-like DNA-binding protein [Streptomyces murinus]UWW91106.1 helix-turn-helix domain-containing protein [Streptomyces murinus]
MASDVRTSDLGFLQVATLVREPDDVREPDGVRGTDPAGDGPGPADYGLDPAGDGPHLGAERRRDASDSEADGHRWPSGPPGPGTVVLSVQDAGAAVITQGDRSAELAPGDMMLNDPVRPWQLTHDEPIRLHVFRVPQGALAVSATDLRRIVSVPIRPRDGGVAALLSPMLRSLASTVRPCPPWLAERLASHTADLLATLVTERSLDPAGGSAPPTAVDPLVIRIRRYVDEHLADPGLSPGSVAAAHFVSVRHVHHLFATQGTTLGRWIQQRRLEECRRELARAGGNPPAVSAVAHRWGFVSAAHFSRAFRRAYGMSPTEWRRSSTPPAPDHRHHRSPSATP